MRVLMLEPRARDQHAGVGQRLDHRLVGIALLALVGEHALAGEARRLVGEAAVGIDGVGNGRVDAARGELRRIRRPDIEVVAAVAGRGVDEASAGIVGDVIAGQQRHFEVVAAIRCRVSGWSKTIVTMSISRQIMRSRSISGHPRLPHDLDRQFVGER